jgi:hypothetical protein
MPRKLPTERRAQVEAVLDLYTKAIFKCETLSEILEESPDDFSSVDAADLDRAKRDIKKYRNQLLDLAASHQPPDKETCPNCGDPINGSGVCYCPSLMYRNRKTP